MAYLRISPEPVTAGGTGVKTLTTAYGVLCAGTTATGAIQTLNSLGTSGWVLTSQGAGSLPQWAAASGGGITTLNGDTGSATGATVTIAGTANQITTAGASATITLSIPSTFIAPGTIEATTTVKADTFFLMPTTSSTVGQLKVNSVSWMHAYGTDNVWMGNTAGSFTLTGTKNIGIGTSVLSNSGFTGSNTVAIGYKAGIGMVAGTNNVLVGYQAGGVTSSNGNCSQNVLIGYNVCNQTGSNTTDNVIIGYNAATAATNRPFQSVIIGSQAFDQQTGNNTANNIIIGYQAGHAFTTTESSNVIIGNTAGTIGDSNTTRIGNGTGTGTGQQNKCFISGIQTITVTGTAVLVSSSDQLGIAVSSARFKENINDMQDYSSDIMKLRPVTFNYIVGEDRSLQSGLVAEEVAAVMPQLVVNDKEGLPQSVKYHDLPALLLNELQKQAKKIEYLEEKIEFLVARILEG